MKQYLNGYLITGGLILLILMLVIITPSLFTDKNPYATNVLDSYTDDQGQFQLKTAPFSPDAFYKLGTDDSGRDVLSFIIYGTQLTIAVALMVTFLRFLIALIVGIASGYDHVMPKVLIEQFNNVFNAVPPILICILILNIPYLKTLNKTGSTGVFIFVLTLVEWAKIGDVISERVAELRQKDFIKSEIIIGKSSLHVIFANIIPHLLPELFVLFFMEIARVLALLMQLGIFNVFIGNLRIVASTDGGSVVGKATSFEPEWSSMLGSAKNYIRTAPWIVFSSAFAFFTVVLGFNLVGEGLRIQLKKMSISQMSPKNALRGVIALVLTATLITSPIVFSAFKYNRFDLSKSEPVNFDATHALVADKAQSNYIINRLKELGIQPLEDKDYTIPYQDVQYQWVEEISFKCDDLDLLDVHLYTFQSHEATATVIDGRALDLIALDSKTIDLLKDHYVLIEPSLFRANGWLNFAHKILEKTEAKGVLVLSDEITPLNRMGTNIEKGLIASIPKIYEEALLTSPLAVAVKSEQQQGTLSNIAGIIKGHPDENDPKCIIMGFDLNFQDEREGERRFQFIFNLLKQLKATEDQLTKSIMIVFWDGTSLGEISGKSYYQEHYMYPIKHSEFYLELTNLKFNDMPSVYNTSISLDTHLISSAKPIASNFTNLMKDNMTFPYTEKILASYTKEPFYYKWGIPTLYMSSDYLTPELANAVGNLMMESIVFELY
ncbi:ABC transporter permease [Fusibacter ferrireducens]|uniref:ABC transporter permease n=1 Tax=Fusibacter ferrireducens TaxID=2785058 RepID=A0ABR9ZSS1_9FIRM|nr:ABC transporter permease [Fusibacter ferrireducens]MBF4693509.1 ABC transporter permease [Fusibacter ferrireducens]